MKEQDRENIFTKGRAVAEELSSVMTGDASCRDHLDQWLFENKYSADLVDKFTDEGSLVDMCENFSQDKEKAIARLSLELNRKNKRRMRLWIASSAAAVVLLSFFVSLSSFIYNADKQKSRSYRVLAENREQSKELVQGKPLLITGDGNEIDLSQVSVIGDGYAKAKGDSLSYQKSEVGVDVVSEVKYNKLVLPDKYTYVVTLSDGTKVHLNANSTLEYPIAFSGGSREVKLSGEAYFDVSKDTGSPFIVSVGDTKVRVYGTKFNVNAYDVMSVKTSLVSGSVGVSHNGDRDVMVRPGQMLTYNIGNEVNCFFSTINIHKYEAWLNGYFRCDNEDVSVLLEDIARWYGVDFEYEYSESKRVKLSASIDRLLPIGDVITLIEESSTIKFTKKGGNTYLVR